MEGMPARPCFRNRFPRRWRRRLFRRLYHELAWAYDAVSWIVSLGAWDAWRRLALDYVHGERLLEVGSGTGALLVTAAQTGLNPIGVDRSAAMLRRSQKRLQRHRQPARLVLADWRALPFGRATFDTVMATFPAEVILESTAWHELARVLAPGGRFVAVITVFPQDPLLDLLHRWLDRLLPPDEEAVTLWRRLPQLAQAAGGMVRIERRRVRRALVPVLIATRPRAQALEVAAAGETDREEAEHAL
jgi:ubiquinone/menaquinone biosynthesis C-methylase UbiE